MCTLDAELGRQSGGPRDEGAVARHIAWCRVAGGVTEPLAVPRPRVCRRRAPRAFARVWHRWLTGLLLVAGLVVLAATPPMPIPRGGDLRIRGGATHNEGRLEVYHDNE